MIEFDPTLVHEWLSQNAKLHPDKEALICNEQRWTYSAIDKHTSHLAMQLIKMGLNRQRRVAILLDDPVSDIISIYGTLKAGAVFVNLEKSLKAPKLSYILENSDASLLITDTSKANIIAEAFDSLQTDCKILWTGDMRNIPDDLKEISSSWGNYFADFSEEIDLEICRKNLPRTIEVDLACLIYTSGSTGEPKGVMSTHHNMISAARSIVQYVGNETDDIILNVLPLSFDYGLYQVIMAFMFGGTVVQETNLVYINSVLKQIENEKITGFPLVPTVAAMLLRLQNLDQYDFSTLRYITNTGAALPVDHIFKLKKIFEPAKLFSMFGLTECKRVSYLPPDQLDKHPSSVGKAMPNCETFIVDELGAEVSHGQIGELVIRGANVMQGYYNAPEATAKAYRRGIYRADAMLYSGDYFKKDKEGYLYFVGRKDDMIKSKGERISPKELENNICQMLGVAEVAIVGVPDEILGQAIKAFIVPSPGCELAERQVLKFCSKNLETFAIPKYIEFIEALPKTPNRKVDRKKLKAKALAQFCKTSIKTQKVIH